MLTLHLRSSSFCLRQGRLLLGIGVIGLALVAGAAPVVAGQGTDKPDTAPAAPATAPAAAQPAADAANSPAPAPPAAPVIHFRERPPYPAETQRLRRTVQIDGVLGDGEWDPFYTVTDGTIKGTFYCNWDDNYLYLATRTEQPADVLFDIDAGGDGWLRGADNLEVVVGSVVEGGTPAVIARLLDAASSKDAPAWNDKAIDPSQIRTAEKITNGTQVLEIAIPRNVGSIVLRPGATIGLRAEFLPPGPPSAIVPTAPFEPHLLLDATLVEAESRTAFGINPRLTLSDYKCIPGQTLFATLELLNQTDSAVPVKSVLWAGRGSSENAVNSLREVVVPPIPGTKTVKLKYRTPLGPDLSVGSYLLTVTVDMDKGKQVQASAAFTVVEPLQVQMKSDPEPVAIVGQTKVTVDVDVYSAVPDHMDGNAELTSFPAGWELVGPRRRGIHVDHEDGNTVSRFVMKVPSITPAGDYPVEALVTWRGHEWRIRHSVHVIRTDAPVAPKP